jgi:hypothetical protein
VNYNNANTSITEDLEIAIKRCIAYNPETGALYWVDKYSKYSPVVIGREIGTPNKSGLHFTFMDKDLLNHRVAWFLYYGSWPESFIDHKDGDPRNNQIDNLRLANWLQNAANRKPSKSGSSRYLGVCFAKDTGKWQASIGTTRKYLGQYALEDDAAMVYNVAAKELYGEYARLNEI